MTDDQSNCPKIASLNSPTNDRIPAKKSKKTCLCPILGCGTKLVHNKNLKRHLDTFHGELDENGAYVITRLQCVSVDDPTVCNKLFLNHFNFVKHHREQHNDVSPKFLTIKKSVPDPYTHGAIDIEEYF